MTACGEAAFGAPQPTQITGGKCCRCRIVEGTATMDENVSLERWEIAVHFKLSSQARPDTDRLVLDFDVQ